MVLERLLGKEGTSKEDKLLYLISSNSTDGVLRGRKKLTKLVFFTEHWLPEEDLLSPEGLFGGFNFIIYKFGPFSKELFITFDELKDEGLVEEIRKPRGNSRIHVTQKGELRLRNIQSNLSRHKRNQVQAVSERLSNKPGHVLEDMSLEYLEIEKSEKQDYMGMPVSVIISEQS